MKVNSFWAFIGAIIFLAVVATVLSKNNTSSVLTSAGTAFSGILGAATAG